MTSNPPPLNAGDKLTWPDSKVQPNQLNIHLHRLRRMHCPGQAAFTDNDWADRLAGNAATTSDLWLGRSEVLRSSRHYLSAQSQGHHTVDCLEDSDIQSAWQPILNGNNERRKVLGNLVLTAQNGANLNQIKDKTISEATPEKSLWDRVELRKHTQAFPRMYMPSWTELTKQSARRKTLLTKRVRPWRLTLKQMGEACWFSGQDDQNQWGRGPVGAVDR